MFRTITFAALLLLAAACQKLSDNPTQQPLSPTEKVFQREMPHFSKRLKQMKLNWRSLNWDGSWSYGSNHTTYFYDEKKRIDSLSISVGGNYGVSRKIIYDADGRVEKLRSYDNNGKVNSELFYAYNEQGLVKSSGKKNSPNPTNFEYNAAGFLVRLWVTGGEDKTLFTLNNNYNPVKTQRFYSVGGKEHYLHVAKYDEGWNPLYAAGLYDIFPGECSPNNATFGQIVHWDCADYDGSARTRQLTYDAEGLLLKVEDTLGDYWEEYIYE